MLDLAPLAEHFHTTANLGSTFDRDVFLSTLKMLADQKRLAAFGMFHEEKLVGCLLGTVAPHFLARESVSQELMWWVEPEHRGNSGALKLVLLFERWAKERGAFLNIMASFAGTDGDDRLEAIYKQRGYSLLEKHFHTHL